MSSLGPPPEEAGTSSSIPPAAHPTGPPPPLPSSLEDPHATGAASTPAQDPAGTSERDGVGAHLEGSCLLIKQYGELGPLFADFTLPCKVHVKRLLAQTASTVYEVDVIEGGREVGRLVLKVAGTDQDRVFKEYLSICKLLLTVDADALAQVALLPFALGKVSRMEGDGEVLDLSLPGILYNLETPVVSLFTPSTTAWQALTTFESMWQATIGLHELGLVHGDVKPENMILVPGDGVGGDEDGGLVKFIDLEGVHFDDVEPEDLDSVTLSWSHASKGLFSFGMIKLLEESDRETTDPFYVEVMRHIDEPSAGQGGDMYALGLTFAQLLLLTQGPDPATGEDRAAPWHLNSSAVNEVSAALLSSPGSEPLSVEEVKTKLEACDVHYYRMERPSLLVDMFGAERLGLLEASSLIPALLDNISIGHKRQLTQKALEALRAKLEGQKAMEAQRAAQAQLDRAAYASVTRETYDSPIQFSRAGVPIFPAGTGGTKWFCTLHPCTFATDDIHGWQAHFDEANVERCVGRWGEEKGGVGASLQRPSKRRRRE